MIRPADDFGVTESSTDEPRFAQQALVVASDLHIGLWSERNDRYSRKQKARAMAAVIRLANDNRASLLLNGDILDDRARRKDLRREAAVVREQLEAYGAVPILVRGNHDWDLPRRRIRKRLGRCIVVDGLIHSDASGVVATHGHFLDTKRARKLIQRLSGMSRRNWKAVNRWLKRDGTLREELAADRKLDLAAAPLERVTALRLSYERAECAWSTARTWLADSLRRLSDSRHLHYLANGVDLKAVRRAGQLAGVLHGWAAVFGHNHTPGVYLRRAIDPASGQIRQVAVGNSGSFVQHKQPITCLLAQHPKMALLAWDPGADAMVAVEEVCVAPAIAAPVVREALAV